MSFSSSVPDEPSEIAPGKATTTRAKAGTKGADGQPVLVPVWLREIIDPHCFKQCLYSPGAGGPTRPSPVTESADPCQMGLERQPSDRLGIPGAHGVGAFFYSHLSKVTYKKVSTYFSV